MEEAAVEEDHAATDGETRTPARINIRVEFAFEIGDKVQWTAAMTPQVNQESKGGLEMSGAGVSKETSQLTSRVSDERHGHVGEPEESPNQLHVSLALSGHLVVFTRTNDRLIELIER